MVLITVGADYIESHADAEALDANSQKAQTVLGWKQQRTIENSIKTAYKWEEHFNA